MAEWNFIRKPFILNFSTLMHAVFLTDIPKEVINLTESYYTKNPNGEMEYIIKKPDEPLNNTIRCFSRRIDAIAYLYPRYIENTTQKFPGRYIGFEGEKDFGRFIGAYNSSFTFGLCEDRVHLEILQDTKRAINAVLKAYKEYKKKYGSS